MSLIATKIRIKEYTKEYTGFTLKSSATGTIQYNRQWWFINGKTSYGDSVQHVFAVWIDYDRYLLDNTSEIEL